MLNCRMDNFVCLMGLLCSSFVSINRATNKRYPFDPLGDQRFPSVQIGNALAARMLGLIHSHHC